MNKSLLLKIFLFISLLYFIGSMFTAVYMVAVGEMNNRVDFFGSLFTLACLFFIPLACNGLLKSQTYFGITIWRMALAANVIGFFWGSYELFIKHQHDLSTAIVIWSISLLFFIPAFLVLNAYIKVTFPVKSITN